MRSTVRLVLAVVAIALGTSTPAAHGAEAPNFAEYSLPAGSDARDVTLGPDDNLWITAYKTRQILRVTSDGAVTAFPVIAGGPPLAITSGPDGNLWFTHDGTLPCDTDEYFVSRITPQGDVTDFSLGISCGGTGPLGITTGPDGNLWFTETHRQAIGRMTPSGEYASFPLSQNVGPAGITTGPDDNLWFTYLFDDSGVARVGRITTDGVPTNFDGLSYNAQPVAIVTGPDGALWFTEAISNQVARMTTSGEITQFNVALESHPGDIAFGSDNHLWFTEAGISKIGRLDTNGELEEYATPSRDAGPNAITLGPGRNIWFLEPAVDKLAVVGFDSTALPPWTGYSLLGTLAVFGGALFLRTQRR